MAMSVRSPVGPIDPGLARAGAGLLVIASLVSLIVSVWHSVVGGVDLSGKPLAELMISSGWWAQMHMVGSFAFALLAVATLILIAAPGPFGTGTLTRTGLAFALVGAAAGSIGFVVDGQRAFLAPAVVRGEDPSIFVTLTYLWDDRGIGALAFTFMGLGGAILAASQLGRTAVSPNWAAVLGIVGGLAAAIFFFFAFGLRIFLLKILGFPSIFAFGWLILAGAMALRRTADEAPTTAD